jgi:hypothetical protein
MKRYWYFVAVVIVQTSNLAESKKFLCHHKIEGEENPLFPLISALGLLNDLSIFLSEEQIKGYKWSVHPFIDFWGEISRFDYLHFKNKIYPVE